MSTNHIDLYVERVRAERIARLTGRYVAGTLDLAEFERGVERALTGPVHEATDADRMLVATLLLRRAKR